MSRISERFRNRRDEIVRLGEVAERFAAEHKLPDDDVMAINLVLDEILTNIIEYGYDDQAEHEIHVTMAVEGDVLFIEIEDDARHFNPLEAPPPDLTLPLEERPVGGLGIHIMRTLMDTVEHQRRDGRNILTMRKTIGRS